MMKAREAAYLALLNFFKNHQLLSESLEKWNIKENPSSLDYGLAQEISYGVCRMALALDYIAEKVSTQGKLKLKVPEKTLLRLSIYQSYFLEKIPLYAILDQSTKLANKYCHKFFKDFLYAILKKIESERPELPSGEALKELSISFSYPIYYVEQLINQYPLHTVKKILEAGNHPAVPMARVRKTGKMVRAKNREELKSWIKSPQYYIQNSTPAELINAFSKKIPKPKKILDLCASPGGKSIAVHDIFPEAILYANDVSIEKIERLKENFEKYQISAILSCFKGELFESDQKFDLIILDVPCSNTGVLNKRPEARWRLSEQEVASLQELQLKILENAQRFLTPEGQIWYMTCSILEQENGEIVQKFVDKNSFAILESHKFLPDKDGSDGGFGSRLKKMKGSNA